MTEKPCVPAESASQLQEAIDTIVQTFQHPPEISIKYTVSEGAKQTLIEVQRTDEESTYELVYNGELGESEPELTRRK